MAIRSSYLSRTHRERLQENGFLKKVIKGWYIPANPADKISDSTTWYTLFWQFCSQYLDHRFNKNWCVSPEQSILLHAGNLTIPQQLLVRAEKTRNNPTQLPFETSILDVCLNIPLAKDTIITAGMRCYSIEAALIYCSPQVYIQYPTDMRVALSIADLSIILEKLLDGGHSVVAGRLAAAFENIGRTDVSKEIVDVMTVLGYRVKVNDPFETT